MTANIAQHVVPRRHTSLTTTRFSRVRSWRTSRSTTPPHWHRFSSQRGGINSTTLTITLAVTLIASVAALSFVYLNQVLNTASHGTDVQGLEERLVELQERQRELELEGAQLRSIETIEESIPELNLIETSHVAYLRTAPTAVAQANDAP